MDLKTLSQLFLERSEDKYPNNHISDIKHNYITNIQDLLYKYIYALEDLYDEYKAKFNLIN